MDKEDILDGIDRYDKRLAQADDYYENTLKGNLKKVNEKSKQLQDFVTESGSQTLVDHALDSVFTENTTKELKKKGKAVLQFVKDTQDWLEPDPSSKTEEIFRKLDESVGKTNAFINKAFNDVYDTISSAKSAVLSVADALGLSTGEKSFNYEFYNPDIYRLSHAGPDFMPNMFTAYLSNTSWAGNSEITKRSNSNGGSFKESEINKVFAFRVTSLTLPKLAAKEGPTLVFANQQIKKISAMSSTEYKGSITVRLDNKLGMWFLDTVGGVSQGKFGKDDDINTIYPKVFFPNGSTSYGNTNGSDTSTKDSTFDGFWFPPSVEETGTNGSTHNAYCQSQNLIVSMSNIGGFRPDDVMTLVEWIKNSKVEAQGLQKWLDALNSSFEDKASFNENNPYAWSYKQANNSRNIYPVYVFKNVKFVTKPSIALSRDSDDIITAQFDFIYSQVVKAFGRVKVSKAE